MQQRPERVFRDIGRRLAELREARGWTQEEAAEHLTIGIRYLQKLEGGKASFTLTTLIRLVNRYGVPVAAVFEPPRTRVVKRGRPRRR